MNQASIIAVIVAVLGGTGFWTFLQSMVQKRNSKTDTILQDLHELKQDMNNLKKGEQELLKDRLNQGYRYHMKNGFITTKDKEIWLSMYDMYHNRLGLPNGVMSDHFAQIVRLPEKVD